MNDKILEAIEASLPQIQVTAIRKALTELEELRTANKELEREKKSYFDMWREQRELADKLATENINLAEQLDKATANNVELTAKNLEARVVLAEGKLEAVNTTVDKFLKNTIYRESMQHQVADEFTSVQIQYVNGQQVAVPTPGKMHKQVTDVKERTTE